VSAQVYDSPESVEFDMVNDRYLVSNTASNEILARDQSGNLTLFATTSSAPYGLEILGNVVYACQTGGLVKGYDLTSGAEVFSIATGGQFLNGITTDGTNLFVTDFNADQILEIDVANQTFSVLVTDTDGTPNGILYSPLISAVLVTFWGPNAPLKAYDVSNGFLLTMLSTTLTNIDGIALDCQNMIYVSSWSPDQITRFTLGSATSAVMPWVVNNPADLDYDEVNDRVCIPSSGSNSVTLETVSSCAVGVQELAGLDPLNVYPVPAQNTLFVETGNNEQLAYAVIDSQGRSVLTGSVGDKRSINLEDLVPGHYILKLADSRVRVFTKE